ncbi:MAG: transcription antitermination factor NusB [Granulosicoccus sp.]|nr:transcription antitermination factor NusB [Granulosicoccus sp.]
MKRNARERALQALYLWDVSGADSDQVQREIIESQDMSRVDLDYFKTLFSGIAERNQLLDSTLEPCLDRPLVDLDPIERAVLRIATFELMLQPEIPARVIINEGIEITKRFGADKGHRYINGVLDKLANRQRPAELGAGG